MTRLELLIDRMIRERLSSVRARITVVFFAFVLWTSLLVGWFSHELSDQAADTRVIALRADSLATQIQDERIDNILSNCKAQNQRYDNAVRVYDRLVAAAIKHATPAEIARARASRTGTVTLINALAPKRDCQKVLRDQIGTLSPNP